MLREISFSEVFVGLALVATPLTDSGPDQTRVADMNPDYSATERPVPQDRHDATFSQQDDPEWAETEYLLSSRANARRLLEARSESRDSDMSPAELGEFWARFGLTDE